MLTNFTKYKEILEAEASKYDLHYCGEIYSDAGDVCHAWCGTKYDLGAVILAGRDAIARSDDDSLSLEEYFRYTTDYSNYKAMAYRGTEDESGQILLVTEPRYH